MRVDRKNIGGRLAIMIEGLLGIAILVVVAVWDEEWMAILITSICFAIIRITVVIMIVIIIIMLLILTIVVCIIIIIGIIIIIIGN